MKLAYIIGIVTVLLNQAFGTYLKKSSKIEEESPSTEPLQSQTLNEKLTQLINSTKKTNKSDCKLNTSETRHLVIVKLPKGKDNRYVDHFDDRIFPIFSKDTSNSNAEDTFDGATDKRCAQDVIKNSDRILAIRGKAVSSLPGGISEASKGASFNQQSVKGGYDKSTTSQQTHVFKRPGSYNVRPTLLERPKLIVKLDTPKKTTPKKVSDIFQSPLSIYQRRKPTTGPSGRPQSPFGVGYKDRRKGYEKPPGILVTDYHRSSLFNRDRLPVDPLKIISNKDVGVDRSNPGYYPTSPFNNRFSSPRIFGKTNNLYNFPKLPITSKTEENILQPKLHLKKKYKPIIGRNEGINNGLIIVTKSNKAIMNKDKAVGIDENNDVTQKSVSYGRNEKKNNYNNGSQRIDLLRTNDTEELLFADPVHGSKNYSSSEVKGLHNKESIPQEGMNNKENNLVDGTKNKETDKTEGIVDKESDLEGMNDKENNLVDGTNNKESDVLKGIKDKEGDLVDRSNNKENDITEEIVDKASDLVEGMNDKENSLVDGTNNKETDITEGIADKESDLVEGMNDKENSLVDGTNNKETDITEGIADEESDLVEGMNDKENSLVDGTNNKESDVLEEIKDKENRLVDETNNKETDITEGIVDKESDLVEGMNNKEINLVDGTNNVETDITEGIVDKKSDLVEGMDDKENKLVDGTNNEETDITEGILDKGSDLVEGLNDKENNLVDGTNNKESDVLEGIKDNESDLVEGISNNENNLVDGTNNKESDVLEGIKDKESDLVEGISNNENNLVDGTNNKESDVLEGIKDKESDLVEGMNNKEINDKESYLVEEINDKESNLFHQTKIEDDPSKNQVNEETLMNNTLNHSSNEQAMFTGKNENEKSFIPSKKISTNVMDGKINSDAITEMNSLNNEETTTFHYVDEKINDNKQLFDIYRNTTSSSSNNRNDNRPTITVMIDTRNYSEKVDKNQNELSVNESMSQLSNISPPDSRDYTNTNKSNKVPHLLNNHNENADTTPMPFLEMSIPKAIHESLMNEHNSIHTTDKSFVEISKNSAGSNNNTLFTEEHNYESKEMNTRNAESPPDYFSYRTTTNKDDLLPDIFNYSRELPKVVLAPEIIDYHPHELVEGQFVKLQPELFDRSDSESYLEKDMHNYLKDGQLSEVYDDKSKIHEKDKRDYLFEEPLQHYATNNDNLSPKNELSDNINNEYTYIDYENDYGKSQPSILSSVMEDFPSSSHKSKSVDDSLSWHGSNIDDEKVGSLDITKGQSIITSENTNPYEATGPGPYFGGSHSESDTMTVDEFKRRSHDVFPSYEYIDLNNPDNQLKNIGRGDYRLVTTNYGNIVRENKEDLRNPTVARTIEDTNPSNDLDRTLEIRKIPPANKYSKENVDLKSENEQIETADSLASKKEESLINQIFDHIKLKNNDKNEYIANNDEYNIHNLPKLINNYVYPETTGARTDSEDMRLNIESSKCLGCDYGLLSKSKPTKESDENYEIINANTSKPPKQICIHVDDKGDIKDDTMKLLYQVLTNKATNISNPLADRKLSNNSGENQGTEKISDNIFNLLVRHLNNANARKQLEENYQNLSPTSKTEIDEETPAFLDLSDQSSERKETYNHNHRIFKNPNEVQHPDEPFTDVNKLEAKEFSKGFGTMMSSNESKDSQELLNVISKVMRKVQRSRPTYRNMKMCGKKKCNDFIGRRTELMKNIIGSLHEYVIEDKNTN